MPRHILVIEDDPDIAHLVKMHLRDQGYEVTLTPDGIAGLQEARTGSYDLIILDLMLPEMDGLDVCRKVRAHPGYTPILMLTAKSAEIDRVLGLEIGADDYLTKPFSIRELIARVKALFRRVEALAKEREDSPQMIIRSGPLEIHTEKRKVTLEGRAVELTAKEYDLLLLFASHPGRVFTRAQLLDRVWGYGHDGYEHTVNSHINRLRGKIEADVAHPRYILTVWGVGYQFSEGEGP